MGSVSASCSLRRSPNRSLFQNVSFHLAPGANWMASIAFAVGRMFHVTTLMGSFIQTAPQYPSVGTFLILRSKPIFLRFACMRRQVSSMPPVTGATKSSAEE